LLSIHIISIEGYQEILKAQLVAEEIRQSFIGYKPDSPESLYSTIKQKKEKIAAVEAKISNKFREREDIRTLYAQRKSTQKK